MDLAEKRNQQARLLSGGMQRRLNLAMALVHDPQIVVLDEPEAGLDPQSRVLVREYIRSLARRKTVILTTHNMDEADRLADRVAIIDHGRCWCWTRLRRSKPPGRRRCARAEPEQRLPGFGSYPTSSGRSGRSARLGLAHGTLTLPRPGFGQPAACHSGSLERRRHPSR